MPRLDIRIALALLVMTSCASGPQVDVVPLGPSPSPVPLESVQFADPAPEGCASIARLELRTNASGPRVRERFRQRAAELGANVLVFSVGGAAPVDVTSRVSVLTTQYSALALACP